MSFYRQPNDWSCGPFALKNALLALGRIIPEDDIAKVAETHWWSGTDEIRLARAARKFGVELVLHKTRRPDKGRRLLTETLKRRVPVLLCVDQWEHWITVVRHEASRFVIIDSNLDPVLDALTWPQLQRRWRYRDVDYDPDDPPEVYDFLAVEPKFRVAAKADFSLARIRHLRRAENHRLAQHWNTYLEDLLEICRPPSARVLAPLSMAEFLRRNQDLITDRVSYWHGAVPSDHLRRVLHNLRFVAETYGLIIPDGSRRRAAADLAILLTMAACVRDPIEAMYGLED